MREQMPILGRLRKRADDFARARDHGGYDYLASDEQMDRGAADEIERLQTRLAYAYRVIDRGYRFGTFDFSILRTEAREFVATDEARRDQT